MPSIPSRRDELCHTQFGSYGFHGLCDLCCSACYRGCDRNSAHSCALRYRQAPEAALVYGRWAVLFVLVLLSFSLLYRYGPSQTGPRPPWITFDSIVDSIVWITGSSAFSYYLVNFGNYDATYGSLGAGIGMMKWMWISVAILLLGAELDSEIAYELAARGHSSNGIWCRRAKTAGGATADGFGLHANLPQFPDQVSGRFSGGLVRSTAVFAETGVLRATGCK